MPHISARRIEQRSAVEMAVVVFEKGGNGAHRNLQAGKGGMEGNSTRLENR